MSELREALESRWDEIHGRWPDLGVSLERFVAHVEALGTEDVAALDRLHLADLYLALGCAEGDPAALKAFERDVIGQTVAPIRALDSTPAFVDEVQQRVRARLLVAEAGAQPRIFEYRGRGPLGAWVTVTAVRTGLTLLRESKRAARFGDERWAAAVVLPQTGNPELDHFKARYQRELGEALSKACDRLADRERAVLRMYFVDGLNIDKIGRVYGVHRSTVARWIARAREQIIAGVNEVLVSVLAVPPEELSSINRLVRSQLDISLDGLLHA